MPVLPSIVAVLQWFANDRLLSFVAYYFFKQTFITGIECEIIYIFVIAAVKKILPILYEEFSSLG